MTPKSPDASAQQRQPDDAQAIEGVDRMVIAAVPLVLTIQDMVRLLKMSRRQVDRLRRIKAFPFPEIDPPLDGKPRWLGETFIRVLRTGVWVGQRRRQQVRKAWADDRRGLHRKVG